MSVNIVAKKSTNMNYSQSESNCHHRSLAR